MNLFDVQTYYQPKSNSKLRKRTYKQGDYKVYSFSRIQKKHKPSHSYDLKKSTFPDEKQLNKSCYCCDCGGQVFKKLIIPKQQEKATKINLVDLEKPPHIYEVHVKSSGKPSQHTPQNKVQRNKFKPMTHILQMIHVKSVLSKLSSAKPIKQQMFQSSPNTVSEFTQKSQFLSVPEPQNFTQTLITQQRIKTEPALGSLQIHFVNEQNKIYYPRVSRISQLGITSLLNVTEGYEKRRSKVNIEPLTNRIKSPPQQQKIRTLSQRLQCTYFRNCDSKFRINKQ